MSSSPSSSTLQLIPLGTQDEQSSLWRRIYTGSNAVVLYNPTSHALAVRNEGNEQNLPPGQRRLNTVICPYCRQKVLSGNTGRHDDHDSRLGDHEQGHSATRAPNYFHLLSLANEANSRPPTRPPSPARRSSTFSAESITQGYFSTFFKEEYRLGMGANGSVHLCQHVLNGNALGHFAVKKVAVGDSPAYLTKLLREVRLLETLHHPNIINYHHAWLESSQFSSFGPPVPTLHILMQWAEGGSLEELIETRSGKPSHDLDDNDSIPDSGQEDVRSRSARIRAFRKRQQASSEERREQQKRRKRRTTPVHLFSALEIKNMFSDIVNGLGFLHAKSVLHLDLKPLNVLLTWDEGSLIPRAMLSDFGTAQDMLSSSHIRSGNTGTLEYCAPESIYRDPSGELKPIDSRTDMWSLGMILHKMVFFKLPFSDVVTDFERLEREILRYSGFKSHPDVNANLKRRCIPRAVSILLESLLNVSPFFRPNCEQIIMAIHEGKLDPLLRDHEADEQMVSLVPRKSPPSPSRMDPIVRERGRLLGGTEPVPMSIENGGVHLAGLSDSDTIAPDGPKPRKNTIVVGDEFDGDSSCEQGPRNNTQDGGASSSETKKVPSGLFRSPASFLSRLRLRDSTTSFLSVPPPSTRVSRPGSQTSENIRIRVIKTLLVLLKVISLYLIPTDSVSVSFTPLLIVLSLALPDLWFNTWHVSVYLLALHLALLSWLPRTSE